MKHQFSVKTPCANCPFRKGKNAIKLAKGRREEIIMSLLIGEYPTFHCHKTVYRKDGRNFDDDDNYRPVDVAHCAGAMAVCRKLGRDPVVVQVATRLKVISHDHYDDARRETIEPCDLLIDRRKAHL